MCHARLATRALQDPLEQGAVFDADLSSAPPGVTPQPVPYGLPDRRFDYSPPPAPRRRSGATFNLADVDHVRQHVVEPVSAEVVATGLFSAP